MSDQLERALPIVSQKPTSTPFTSVLQATNGLRPGSVKTVSHTCAVHQSLNQERDINFSNFDYETGLNVLAGVQSRKGTFVELKTSLYSGPAPKLRVIVGYNF